MKNVQNAIFYWNAKSLNVNVEKKVEETKQKINNKTKFVVDVDALLALLCCTISFKYGNSRARDIRPTCRTFRAIA